MAIGTHMSIITFKVNGLNTPSKRHRLAEWIQKQDPYIGCLQETHLTSRDTHKLKGRGWKKTVHAIGNQKKAGVAILTSDKIDVKMKTILRDKEGHYLMIKGSSQGEDISFQYHCTQHRFTTIYIRQMLTTLKGQISNTTIIMGALTPHLQQWTDHPDRKSIRKHRPGMKHYTKWTQ